MQDRRTRAQRVIAKAYEMSSAAQMDNTYQFEKEQKFLKTLTPENLAIWKDIAVNYPDRSDLVKQAYAQISQEDVRWANEIIQAAYRCNTRKEFDDMLSQLAQPKGGVENAVNVASPGLPPAKIAVVPGESGNYPDKAKPIDGPTDGFTDTRGRYSSAGAYAGSQQAPGAFLSAEGNHAVQTEDGQQQPYGRLQSSRDNPHNRAHLAHGPVGTAGDTSRVNDYQATRPGDVHPRYRQLPSSKIPTVPDKAASVSYLKAANSDKDRGSDDISAMDNSLYKSTPRNTSFGWNRDGVQKTTFIGPRAKE